MLRVQQEAFKQLLDREQKEMSDRRRSGGVAVSSVNGTPDSEWMDG
jgi:ribosome-binding factor A